MKKLLLVLAATFALCDSASAQSITANQFPGFGTVAGTAIQGPGVLGAGTATTLAIGGATIGTDALAVTGTATISGMVAFGNNINLSNSNASIGLRNQATLITSNATASMQFGNFDVDTAPVAQTLRFQGVTSGGTSNVNGANATIIGSTSKGTGTGGSLIFQTSPAGSTGTAVNAPVTALTIDSTKLATFSGQINVTAMTQTSAAQSGTNCYNSGTGAMTYDATLGCLTSLEETKNIQPGGIPEALPEIMALKPFWFTWKDKNLHQDINQQPGLGAHTTEKVDARLVGYGPEGKLRGVRYTEMVALLVAAIQQQQAEIVSLGPMRQCKNLYIRRLACW